MARGRGVALAAVAEQFGAGDGSSAEGKGGGEF